MKELARTNKNIFSWLKPEPTPILKVAKVVEMECKDEIENIDMVNTVPEERLELECACLMLCKGLVMEKVDKAVIESERVICDDWIRTTLLDKTSGRERRLS